TITKTYQLWLDERRKHLLQTEKQLALQDPKRLLSLGYSIAKTGGLVVRSTTQVKSGDLVDITVSDGTIESKVT
ncbi:MAG: exodeoxyribonuclease VII large subunit, partial [bacterium]